MTAIVDRFEQELELNNAIQLFVTAKNFEEFDKGLLDILNKSTKVSNPEKARERVVEIAETKKSELMKNNPEFNTIMKSRKREVEREAEYDRAIRRAKMAEVKTKASMTRVKAASYTRGKIPDKDLDDWVAQTKIKTRTFAEAEEQSKMKLWCPICKQEDTFNNTVNGDPTCMKCMHKLVSEDKLKDYNREYRRKWKRRKRMR